MPAPQLKPKHILETSLYIADLARAGRFYRETLGLEPMVQDARMWALDCGPASVLLLFKRGGVSEPVDLPGGRIPGHDGQGRIHLAFAIGKDELPAWEKRLDEADVKIEARMTWAEGGRSLYFRDPDDNLLELATPGLWANY